MIYGLGKSAAATRTAVQELPGEITLAFWPHSRETDKSIAAAHAAGHETLMMLSMGIETQGGPDLARKVPAASINITEFRNRLNWILGRGKSYVGIMNVMGSHYTSSPSHMQIVLTKLKKRNLLFLSQKTGTTTTIRVLSDTSNSTETFNSLYLDQKASRTAIDKKFSEIERIAKRKGQIIVMGFPYPVTFERLKHWITKLKKKKMLLVPISYISTK